MTVSFFLNKSLQLTLRYPKSTLLIATLLTVIAICVGQQLSLRSNFSDLLPDDHPAVIQARMLNEVVGGASFIVVAVETEDPAAAGRFIDELGQQVRQLPGIRYVDDHPPSDFLRKNGLLYLSIEELDDLHQRIQKQIEQNKLKRAGLFIDLESDEDEKWDLTTLNFKYAGFLAPNSYYQNREQNLLVSLIKPEWRTTNVARTQQALEQLHALLGRLDPVSYHPSLRVRLTGPYVKALKQQQILKEDVVTVSIVALLGAIAYLIFHFRRKRAVFLVAIPLIASISWVLALAAMLFGSLNLFSSVTGAVVVGLGADYGIHLYSEYLRQRQLKKDVESALLAALRHLKRAFFVAATTTAAAFFALALSEFKAFSEFGLIAGPGILLCVIAYIWIFPPLVLLIERWHPVAPEQIRLRSQRFFKGERLVSLLSAPRSWSVVTLVLLVPLLSVAAQRLYFDYDLNHVLGSQATRQLDREVDGIFNHTVNPEVALVEDLSDASKLAQAIRRVQQQNRESVGGTTIADVASLVDFVPTAQEAKRDRIRRIEGLFTKNVVASFNAKERESYETFQAMLNPGHVDYENIPHQVTSKFMDREGQEGRLVFIFPNFDMIHGERLLQFVDEVQSVECSDCKGPYFASGESTVFSEILKMIFKEGKYVMFAAAFAIFLVLFMNFRSLQAVFLVYTPLVVCFVSTLGWMGLLGIPFNIISLAAFPIIIGVVTDYIVHFYQRFREDPDGSVESAYRVTCFPILGSAVTTLIGFSSLLLADMGGLRTFGLVTSLGIVLGAVTTLLWFPGFLVFVRRKTPVALAPWKKDDQEAYGI